MGLFTILNKGLVYTHYQAWIYTWTFRIWVKESIRLPDNVTYQLKFKSGKQWKNVIFMNDCKIK